MAALTFQAVLNTDNTHTVTRSTADAIGSAVAALVIDDTATKIDIMDGVRALLRQLSRQMGRFTEPSEIPTSGTDVE